VNASRAHFEAGHDALRKAPPGWLSGLLRPTVSLDDYHRAFAPPDTMTIKSVIRFDVAGDSGQ
jgi:hypothetical protein